MAIVLRTIGLTLLLGFMQGGLIIFPAWLFGIWNHPAVWGFYALSMVFFWGTVRRSIKHGKLADRKDDEQVHSSSGKVAYAVQIIGLTAVYYVGLYEFSLNPDMTGVMFYIGVLFLVAAALLTYHATSTLGKFYDRLAIKSDHRLVTEGIYGKVRHPIYTGHILFYIGFCLAASAPVGLFIFLVVSIVWYGSRMRIEEEMLRRKFGQDYDDYIARTKRLFPFVY